METADFPKFEKMTWREYSADRSQKRDVERWAEQLINAVIDSAEIILASEKRVIPETYKDIVKTLKLVKPFEEGDLCDKLSDWTALRNVLAHEYLDYRWERILSFVSETKPLFRDFTERMKAFLKVPRQKE